jgi:putative transposase
MAAGQTIRGLAGLRLKSLQKGSSNRNRQRIKAARLHERIAIRRKGFLRKQGRRIANAYNAACIDVLT